MDIPESVTKMQALYIIQLATGFGRRIIERRMDELAAQGVIQLQQDTRDLRAYRLSREDVQKVIDSLKA